ncbi:MAG: hypothetical protein KGI19_09185 [Thaumarchaeota archaeon]|nr:hypothetical protein [Nitrososphaerota archaeon]
MASNWNCRNGSLLFYGSQIDFISCLKAMNCMGEDRQAISTNNFSQGNVHDGEFRRGNTNGSLGIGLDILTQPIEMCQIAFIRLYAALSKMISKQKKADNEQPKVTME